MKKVSVIVPCHNAAKWLPQCFLSLVQQSIGIDGLELILWMTHRTMRARHGRCWRNLSARIPRAS